MFPKQISRTHLLKWGNRFFLSLLVSTVIVQAEARVNTKDTILWEYFFTETEERIDMAVRTIAYNSEHNQLFVSLLYPNGTAVYCFDASNGTIIWRLDSLINSNNSKYLLYVESIIHTTSLEKGGEDLYSYLVAVLLQIISLLRIFQDSMNSNKII